MELELRVVATHARGAKVEISDGLVAWCTYWDGEAEEFVGDDSYGEGVGEARVLGAAVEEDVAGGGEQELWVRG